MSEQKEREQIEDWHKQWEATYVREAIAPPMAHIHRGQLLTWLRERDEQIASLQRELARFQRADVGERVREIEQLIFAYYCEARAIGEGRPEKSRGFTDETRRQIVDICRQQAAEIERLNAACVAQMAQAVQLAERLRAYEDAPTDKHERCEPFEKFEELDDSYHCDRCGLGPPARKCYRVSERSVLCSECRKLSELSGNPGELALADEDKTRVITTLCKTALTLSHLNASRVISRADNNKLFEIPWSLLSFAENIMNNYGSGGLWLCVHCIIAHAASEERCVTCGTERHEWDQKQKTEASKEAVWLPVVSIPVLPGNPKHDLMAAERLAEARRGRKTTPFKPASEEAYRPGLPPVALRMVCRDWEHQDREGVTYCHFDGEYVSFDHDGSRFIIPDPEVWSEDRLRPLGKSWSGVEQEAAKALGAEDAKAGRYTYTALSLAEALRITPATDYSDQLWCAYYAAYDAAKGG